MEDKGVPFKLEFDAAKINVEWPVLTSLFCGMEAACNEFSILLKSKSKTSLRNVSPSLFICSASSLGGFLHFHWGKLPKFIEQEALLIRHVKTQVKGRTGN